MVCGIHDFITTIPGQIERQQPVYVTDLYGETAPFHLEFIKSYEVTILLAAQLAPDTDI